MFGDLWRIFFMEFHKALGLSNMQILDHMVWLKIVLGEVNTRILGLAEDLKRI